jgi:hypothetical protein
MCAKGIDFDLVSTILLLDIGTVPTLWHFSGTGLPRFRFGSGTVPALLF